VHKKRAIKTIADWFFLPLGLDPEGIILAGVGYLEQACIPLTGNHEMGIFFLGTCVRMVFF